MSRAAQCGVCGDVSEDGSCDCTDRTTDARMDRTLRAALVLGVRLLTQAAIRRSMETGESFMVARAAMIDELMREGAKEER